MIRSPGIVAAARSGTSGHAGWAAYWGQVSPRTGSVPKWSPYQSSPLSQCQLKTVSYTHLTLPTIYSV